MTLYSGEIYNQSVGWQREIMTQNKLICSAGRTSMAEHLTSFQNCDEEEDGVKFKAESLQKSDWDL